MTTQELNEKLAELLDAKLVQAMQPFYEHELPIFDGHHHILVAEWGPTKVLRQLRMCFEYAHKDDITFGVRFEKSLSELLSNELNGVMIDKSTLSTAIFTHPELVAQAILNAKEGK